MDLVKSYPVPSTAKNLAAPQTLTAVAARLGGVITIADAPNLTLLIDYVPGANTRNLSLYIEVSSDDVDVAEASSTWVQWGDQTVAGGGTLTDRNYVLVRPGATNGTHYKGAPLILMLNTSGAIMCAQKMRIMVFEDGASNFGTVQCWINKLPF